MSEGFSTLSLPASPQRVMEGLRDTGYSFNTAIADIVDKSERTCITVRFTNILNCFFFFL